MLPDRDPHDNDLKVDVLLDALIEMPEPGEQVYSSAYEWPDSYDSIRVWLGAPIHREQAFDDLPDDVEDDTF
jgi:hypothetical protein